MAIPTLQELIVYQLLARNTPEDTKALFDQLNSEARDKLQQRVKSEEKPYQATPPTEEQLIQTSLWFGAKINEVLFCTHIYVDVITNLLLEYALKKENTPKEFNDPLSTPIDFFYRNVQARKDDWLSIPNLDKNLPPEVDNIFQILLRAEQEQNQRPVVLHSLSEEFKQALADDGIRKKVLYWAYKTGWLAFVKWFFETYPEEDRQQVLKSDNYDAFFCACQFGHLELAKWLFEKIPEEDRQQVLKKHNYEAFCYACRCGHLELAKWLFEKITEGDRQQAIQADNCHALRSPYITKMSHVVKWLLNFYLSDISDDFIRLTGNIYDECFINYKDLINYIYDHYGQTLKPAIEIVMNHIHYLDQQVFSSSSLQHKGKIARKRLILLLENLHHAQDKKDILDQFLQDSDENPHLHLVKQNIFSARKEKEREIVDPASVFLSPKFYRPKEIRSTASNS